MTAVVFSKDRALQLDAFLRSYRDHVTPLGAVRVLYLASSPRHAAAYDEVFALHDFVAPHAQEWFKLDLLRLLQVGGNVVFFVDDQVFIRPWGVAERPGLSLRHGPHLTRDYNSHDAPQPLPPYTMDGDLVTWLWADGKLAWGYPLSLDGHVYEAREMRAMIEMLEFRSPNTLESGLQRFVPVFLARRGACYRESKVVNVPWNTVQSDWTNRCANVASADELLAHWEAGKRIGLRGIYGALNESTHQEFPLELEARC